MSNVELLASEVDSLIREIIEAVPAFSYALGQGIYGLLPFSIHNLTSNVPESSPRGYLERIQALPLHGDDDSESETDSVEGWWPSRLKIDLDEGLLRETVEESPNMSLRGFSLLPSLGYPSVSSSRSIMHPEDGLATTTSSQPIGPERSNMLLEEGRKRWLEYKQARQPL